MKKKEPFIKKQSINMLNTILLVIIIILLIMTITRIKSQNTLIKIDNENMFNIIKELNKNLTQLQDIQQKIIGDINIIKKELLTGINKLCALEGLSIKKSIYRNETLKILISNANNQKIEGFSFRFYNEKFEEIDSNESIEEFEIREYSFTREKPESIGIVPKILIDNETLFCNKELKSDVKLFFDLTGTFNGTASLKATGFEKTISMLINVIQEKDTITGEIKVLNKTSSYGKPFTVRGKIDENIITMTGKDITISEGWFEGINRELLADISFNGVIKNDNLIEGNNPGDAKVIIKDFPIPGLTITAEGTFSAIRI